MTSEVIHGKVIAKRNGIYSVFVIETDDKSLRMFTLLPNFGSEYSNMQIGDSGFFTLEYYTAGESYYDRKHDQYSKIRFTNVYFKEFIKDINTTEHIIL